MSRRLFSCDGGWNKKYFIKKMSIKNAARKCHLNCETVEGIKLINNRVF